jgi:dTDP-4-amino-4,6-dideoxygalactose transaminase
MQHIKMVDLRSQYLRLRPELDAAIESVLEATDFIQGQALHAFEKELSAYVGGVQVISCGNGTDALQLTMMALGFEPGDEIIVPVHTYVATAEVIALLKLVPVFVDVDPDTFTVDVKQAADKITHRTVAIVPVHLYGQCANMDEVVALADKHKLIVIEDAAQSLGAWHHSAAGPSIRAGAIGKVGTTSFFPSKNLGAFGDGGAIFTRDLDLALRLRMLANHGQQVKYRHDIVGVNSRLDTLQAAILRVKLKYLDDFEARRRAVADYYDAHLSDIAQVKLPYRAPWSTHVFHQYTLVVPAGVRDTLKEYLSKLGVPTMIYYPIPLHQQPAFQPFNTKKETFAVAEKLSASVISLPIHTEMEPGQLSYICSSIRAFFDRDV